MATSWLQTEIDRTVSAGKIFDRTVEETGTETTTQKDDVGFVITFSVPIRGGLGTVPAGSTPPSPLCT